MGISSSRNVVEQNISSMIEIVNSAATHCTTKLDGVQEIDVDLACSAGDVRIHGNKFNYNAKTEVVCAQNVDSSTNVVQEVEQQAKQMADSAVGALGIGIAKSANVAKLTMDIATRITNRSALNCFLQSSIRQGIYVRKSDEECEKPYLVDVYDNTFDSFNTSSTNCLHDVAYNTTATQKLLQISDQKATAKVESIFSFLTTLILVVVVILIAFVGGGSKAMSSPVVLVVIVLIVFIYGLIGYFKNWWPWNS